MPCIPIHLHNGGVFSTWAPYFGRLYRTAVSLTGSKHINQTNIMLSDLKHTNLTGKPLEKERHINGTAEVWYQLDWGELWLSGVDLLCWWISGHIPWWYWNRPRGQYQGEIYFINDFYVWFWKNNWFIQLFCFKCYFKIIINIIVIILLLLFLLIIIIRDLRWSATYQNNNNNNPKPETGTTCVTCSSNICLKPTWI